MAFKRSGVQIPYPPLHKPRHSHELCRGFFRAWMGPNAKDSHEVATGTFYANNSSIRLAVWVCWASRAWL